MFSLGSNYSQATKKLVVVLFNFRAGMRKGFTLVELSIVLVIIGLLIGGILVAQSMISNSKIVATAAHIQQFDAGVESFKTKYSQLPGDATAFGGNADDVIGWKQNSDWTANQCPLMEIASFWNNLNSDQYAVWTGSPVSGGANKMSLRKNLAK